MFLIFDTETTGLPRNYKAPVSDSENWPRMVQLAWQLHQVDGSLICQKNFIIKPEGFDIPIGVSKVHGITTEKANSLGQNLESVIHEFLSDVEKSTFFVGHNVEFDINIVGAELFRLKNPTDISNKKVLDTMHSSIEFCAIPGGRGGGFKYPSLTDLHNKLFQKGFGDAHDASYDVDATARCFFELLKKQIIKPNGISKPEEIKYESPTLTSTNFESLQKHDTNNKATIEDTQVDEVFSDILFTHLHNHSEFSILQASTKIQDLVNKAKSFGMKAVALTDTGNMMATFQFVKEATKAEIKPIVGCEFYLCKNRLDKTIKDDGFQTVLLAKNKKGYQNLIKLISLANSEGMYYVPRIDRELLIKYKSDLVALSGGIWGEIPNKILFEGKKQAEEALIWWKENFKDDFYIEINRHGISEEDEINEILLEFAKSHQVKIVAANNNFYLNKDDAVLQDILTCIKDGKTYAQPKKFIGSKGREFRFGLPNSEFYFKSSTEMAALFKDLPEAIENTKEISDKIESYPLERDVLLPKFNIPEEFVEIKDEEDSKLKIGENNYLRHITYKGAEERYGTITSDIKERIDFELDVIKKTGYPGYFLIVEDFIREARKMGVSVGPGRGSAAGSVVAYCTKITNIDPIKYDLLFERFLNPDRVSLPDIDIDFDDEGRQKVIDYVINKYGKNQVAQIITYGTMAAKSSIRDAARVLELPLNDAGKLAGLVSELSLTQVKKLTNAEIETKLESRRDDINKSLLLKDYFSGDSLESKTIQHAERVEGAVRNTGTHACGIIITPDDISNYVPISSVKESNMMCTQFDNSVAENAGLLKMDFLGLKTLTIIKDALEIIKDRHNLELDPEKFDIEDKKTYELFQRGETVGIFQYESNGMQKHLRSLKPTVFADLIAMNALYRPGPMEYIPSFIRRKQGDEVIEYDLNEMEEYLQETYGITVYQEQVMLLSQKLAGFTKGEADVLRKAMGKKQKNVLDKMKPQFIQQAMEKGHAGEKLEKIWKDWEAFAAYAFNKSHSTCYAWIAFQTAYLKANYPAEFMASTLSNNMNDIKQITFLMDECKRMGVPFLGPDVNESVHKFTVNSNGEIRFGLGAMKGVGEKAVDSIISERKKNGNFSSVFDMVSRIDLRAANKKTLESLALGGAFDSFKTSHRAQYFAPQDDGTLFLDKIIKYGNKLQESKNSSQVSMFEMFENNSESNVEEPPFPKIEDWSTIEKLKKEKEVVGIFISGHPLDDFKFEITHFSNGQLSELKDFQQVKGKPFSIAGICTNLQERISKNNLPFGIITIEDFSDSFEFLLFGDEYIKYKPYFTKDQFLFVKGQVKARENKWKKPNEVQEEKLEFNISMVQLLSEVREKLTKGIIVAINSTDVTNELIRQLDEIVSKNPGEFQFSIHIVDIEEGTVGLFSRTKKINVSNQFIDELNRIPEIEFSVIQ